VIEGSKLVSCSSFRLFTVYNSWHSFFKFNST